MSSVAYTLNTAQAPTYAPPLKPTKETLLWWMDRNREPNGTFAKPQEWLVDHVKVSRMTIHRWMQELASDTRVKATGWLNRSRVYELLSAPKKPVGSENVTSHVTSQVPSFPKFPNNSNRENKERPQASAFSPSSKPKNGTKTGVWADLVSYVQQTTGQILADWQVGLIARDGKRAGITLTALLAGLIDGRHRLESARNVFALLLSIARRALNRPPYQHKAKETGPHRQPCQKCNGSQVLKIEGHWMFCECRGTK